MAVLNKIRQRSVFLIIIIAMALFAFVLADVFQSGGFTSNKEQNTIATINGTDISRDDFFKKVDNTLRNMGQRATNLQAANMVWDNEVKSTLFKEQIESLGLQISDKQLQDALATSLQGNPTFTNEAGIYDPLKVQEYLADAKVNAPQLYAQFVTFEESISQNSLQNTYLNLIKAGVNATPFEGQLEYELVNQKVDIEFVQIPYTSIPNEKIEVSEKEIQEYINRNSENYQVEAAVDFQYVLFAETPSQEDEKAIENEINKLLEPQIFYNAIAETNDTLPSINETSDIVGFVSQHSVAEFSDKWYFKKDLPKEIADDVFNLNKGAVYGPYKTKDSYNLAKVVEVGQVPDSVKTNHILISHNGVNPNSNRSEEDAKKLTDSLLQVIYKNPSKFEELVLEFSDDPSAEQNKGDIGYITPGSVSIVEYDYFVFNNPKGVIDFIDTNSGFFIVHIKEQKNLQRALQVAFVVKPIVPSEATLNDIFTQATKFEAKALNTDFVTAAKEEGIEDIRPVNRVGALEENIPGLGSNREIVKWAFEKETKEGAIKRFDVNNGYAIVQLTNKTPKGLMPAAEATPQVSPLVRNEKKAKQIIENNKAKTLEELAAANTVEIKRANAISRKSPLIPDAGQEPKVVGLAFGLEQGETSSLIEGKNGVYMIRVLNKIPATEREDYTPFVTQLNTRRATNINNSVLSALKKKADIEDRRANFY